MRKTFGLSLAWLGLLSLVVAPLPARGDTPLVPQAETYTVTSNASDPDLAPDGLCATVTGHCTLRAAIDEANHDGVDSVIRFAQQFKDSNEIHDCDLRLTEAGTTIDASNQWDSGPDTPGVVVVGSCLFLFTISGGHSTVRGLHLGGDSTSIHVIGGGSNTIGGSGPGHRNVFTGQGVSLFTGEGNHQILNNYFGTLNGDHAQGAGSLVVAIDNNIIAGNVILGLRVGSGIFVHLGDGNNIHDNRIGLGVDGQTVNPLAVGIELHGADNNMIGPDNVIGGSTVQGVRIEGGKNNTIVGNAFGDESPPGTHWDRGGIYIGDGAESTLVQSNRMHGCDGWCIMVDDVEVILEGNFITGAEYDGVLLIGGRGKIGGSAAEERNVISGNGRDGIRLTGSDGVTISGNYIGLASNGVDDLGNDGSGITLENGAGTNTIGGDKPGEGNWIAWNTNDGIHLTGAGTQLNFLWGNVLGAPIDWASPAPNLFNGISIRDGAGANFVGGLAAGQANTILASGLGGLVLADSDDNVVIANRIGTDGAGHNWGNGVYGLYASGAENTISNNEIAYNGSLGSGPGVYVTGAGATGNTLIANSIHSNVGPGITLVYGGNGELAAPELTAAGCDGPVAGAACAGCTVAIFSDSEDEGRVYEGQIDADATTGAFSWTGQVNGPNVTATATDAGYNTSPFSEPTVVGVCNTPPTAALTVQPASGSASTVFAFDASASQDNEDAASALEVCWDWQNDGACDTGWQTTKIATHSFGHPALYTVRLRVRDSRGLEDATTQQVTVREDTEPIRAFLPVIVK